MLNATNHSMGQPFKEIAKNYDLINDFMSLGLHRSWKKRLVQGLARDLGPNGRVLDLATGTGDVANLFLGKLQASHVYAVDPCEAMMSEGKKRYPALTEWHQAEAESLPFPDSFFSIVTCTFGIRNFRHRSLAFKEIARVLKTNGKFGILEIHPIPPNWKYFPFKLFWKFGVPLWGRLFRHLHAYQYLRDTAAQFISSEVMVEELRPYFDLEHKKALIGGGLVTLIIFKKR